MIFLYPVIGGLVIGIGVCGWRWIRLIRQKAAGRPAEYHKAAWYFGLFLLWCTLALGLTSHAVELMMTLAGWDEMRQGSCTAALTGLILGVPFPIVSLPLFVVGAVLIKGVKTHAWYAGLIGLQLSFLAFPLWFIIAFSFVP